MPTSHSVPTRAACRILVVDDNRDGADILADLLQVMGADTAVAYDGPSALVAIRKYQPTVVLIDIEMPGMNGIDLAKAIRAEPAFEALRLIALTGWGTSEMRVRSEQAGYNDLWVKPVGEASLRALATS